ncbi:MAG: nuclear transport factor 2 family protein [Bacteroidetes bacterium]|nr:nuclear transport factor 2 family protein [Bacteroidota bacterium]
MITNIHIPDPTVRKAIEALQDGDAGAWLSLFATDAVLYDLGNEMTAGEFIEKSIGREYFTQIDKTEDSGLSVFGSFHTAQFGDFQVSFRFRLNATGGLCRLDVLQETY